MSIINVCLIGSTYLIVLTSIIRYIAIARPFRGRNNSCMRHSGLASLLVLIVVVIMVMPQFLFYKIVSMNVPTGHTKSVHHFTLQVRFKQHRSELLASFINNIQPITSSFVPCLMLIVFNIGLIYQLQRAQISEVTRHVCVSQQLSSTSEEREKKHNRRITVKLIFLFTSHIFLVMPSDIVKYFDFYQLPNQLGDIIACVLNLLQACSVALNFLIFVSLNSSFRYMLRMMLNCKDRRQPPHNTSNTSAGIHNVVIELIHLNPPEQHGCNLSYTAHRRLAMI